MSARPTKLLLALVSLLAVVAAACGSSSKPAASADTTPSKDVTLSLVGYSVAKAGNNAAEAAFQNTPAGKGVKFTESYGASGDQARAVIGGLKADYVHLSIETDVAKIVAAGLIPADWNTGTNKGIVSDSVVVISVRKGNPKNIKTWNDLIKPGIGIVTPNPGSSGSARWNILAAYGQVIAGGGSDADAAAYLTSFFKNVVALPGSGRDATTAFLAGTGDVLISYENEAILARQQDQPLDYFVPDTTLLIENPGAVTTNADPAAKDYLAYVISKAGQTEFAKVGFRPIISGVSVNVPGANNPSEPFPAPKTLLTIDKDFGGWTAAAKKFFDTSTGIVTQIQKATGKSS
jgi:sulfate transport system substrate-binding protein